MKKTLLTLLLIGFLVPGIAIGSEYGNFQKDITTPYGHYKKSVALTSKPKNRDKAIGVVKKYIESWKILAKQYENDVPAPFAKTKDFGKKINRPVAVGQIALTHLEEGNVKKAHEALEEVRYLLWEMRTQVGIVSLNDKINDFHEAMEVVLEGMVEDNSAEHLHHLNNRYGGWLTIKWEEVANVASALDQPDLATKVDNGRKAIQELRSAMGSGDQELAKKQGKMVKKAYKGIFFLPICS